MASLGNEIFNIVLYSSTFIYANMCTYHESYNKDECAVFLLYFFHISNIIESMSPDFQELTLEEEVVSLKCLGRGFLLQEATRSPPTPP